MSIRVGILSAAQAAAPLCALALVLVPDAGVGGQAVGEVFRDCEACPRMIVLPAGTYLMGSPDSETAVSGEGGPGSERPQHLVTIPEPFAVGVYEVAFAEWDASTGRRLRRIPARRRGLGAGLAPGDQRQLG